MPAWHRAVWQWGSFTVLATALSLTDWLADWRTHTAVTLLSQTATQGQVVPIPSESVNKENDFAQI